MPDPAFTFAKVPSTSVSSSTGVATCCFVNTTKPVFKKLQGENKLSWWSSLGELLGFLVLKQLGGTLWRRSWSLYESHEIRENCMNFYVVLLGYLCRIFTGSPLQKGRVKFNWFNWFKLNQFGVREPIALERNPPTPYSAKLQWLWKISETTHPMLVFKKKNFQSNSGSRWYYPMVNRGAWVRWADVGFLDQHQQ